jgi:hypothetical protein
MKEELEACVLIPLLLFFLCWGIDAAELAVDEHGLLTTSSFVNDWPESSGKVGTEPAILSTCTYQTTQEIWQQETLKLHHSTYHSKDMDKALIGVAISVAPRPNGEHFESVLDSIPESFPIILHSRLNYSASQHPKVCAEVRATPVYPQLKDVSKLNKVVQYRATRATDSTERTRWRSNVVLDVARTLEEASRLFHYVLYVEDDVVLSHHLFKRLPELIRGRVRMDVPGLFQEDKSNGKLDFLTNFHKDPQDHFYANGDPWAMLWLSKQGMLAVLWDTRFLPEAIAEMRARFDEKPPDWLVRQIKFDKGWNTPNLGRGKNAFVNHMGARSTFTADKRKRAVGAI